MDVEMVTCVMIQNPETNEVLVHNRKLKYPGWSFPAGTLNAARASMTALYARSKRKPDLTLRISNIAA